jgi:hypothetical protein
MYSCQCIGRHYLPVVLNVDADKAVLVQWQKGYKGTLMPQNFVKGVNLNHVELNTINDCIPLSLNRH